MNHWIQDKSKYFTGLCSWILFGLLVQIGQVLSKGQNLEIALVFKGCDQRRRMHSYFKIKGKMHLCLHNTSFRYYWISDALVASTGWISPCAIASRPEDVRASDTGISLALTKAVVFFTRRRCFQWLMPLQLVSTVAFSGIGHGWAAAPLAVCSRQAAADLFQGLWIRLSPSTKQTFSWLLHLNLMVPPRPASFALILDRDFSADVCASLLHQQHCAFAVTQWLRAK